MMPKKLETLIIFFVFSAFLISPAIFTQAQGNPLPDWSNAGYRGTGVLPSSGDITTNNNCVITDIEIMTLYGVYADDGIDDSTGIQNAIDFVRTYCTGGYSNLSLIELPAGVVNISREIHVDASFLIIRGQGSSGSGGTEIVFEPDSTTVYDGISDFDLGDMTDSGSANGGWIWPGRGAFRVQTRSVHSSYASDYASAPANRADFYEGSVNFHWKGGIVIMQNAYEGDTTLTVASTSNIAVGHPLWVGAPNTANFLSEQGVLPSDWRYAEFNRQQIFTVVAINGNTVTLDSPLEFDVPHDSTADGSSAIGGVVRDAKVIPLEVVEGVGFEDFYLTQPVPGHSPSEATFNYNNIDHHRAMHGIVFKWVDNAYVNNVHTYMTGSHAIVTEMVRHIQIQNSYFDGSWNKGKGGNGYMRLSKIWDSIFQNNTIRNLRHLAVQWSASTNVIQNNDISADLNLHGGWERYNLFQNNIVRVPYEHRDCNPNCGSGAETWYPIWWAAGEHAGGWAGASGPRNIFYNNTLQKQLTSGGSYTTFSPYGNSPGTIFIFGWDRDTAGGSHWEHLALNGVDIVSWTDNQTQDFANSPNAGVNAQCSSTAGSLIGASITCNGQTQPTNTPISPTDTPQFTNTPDASTATFTPTVSGGVCTVTATYSSEWSNGYSAEIFITNDSSTDILSWTLTFTLNNGETVQNIWRAESYNQSGNQMTVSASASHYNGDIDAGDTIDIKYEVDHSGTYGLPTNYVLNGQACNGQTQATNTPLPTNTDVIATNTPLPTNTAIPSTNTPLPTSTAIPPTNTPLPTNTAIPSTNTPVATNTEVIPTNTPLPTSTAIPPTNTPVVSSSCSISVVYDTEWNDGYTAEIFISNTGNTAIDGWTLSFTFNNGETLDNFWRVQSSSQAGNVVTASAGSSHYNGDIAAGATIDVKYQVDHSGSYAIPTNFTLNGQACSS